VLRFFFCFNEVAYTLGREAVRTLPGKTILIVSAERVQRRQPARAVLGYARWVLLVVMALSLLSRRVEVVLPHAKTSPALRWLAKAARRLAFVDDGMDTYRNQPRNLDLGLVRGRARYYTFDHALPLAAWLDRLEVVRLVGIERLADDAKPALQLQGHDCLVIESPGVDLDALPRGAARPFYLTHPNRDKNRPLREGVACASGLDWSAEKTILDFDGDLVVGESMALVFALACGRNPSNIHARLQRRSYQNLACLHATLAACGSLELTGEP
jgi:hypothetical protein